ncbi:MAG: hypothetical protein Q9163_002481 [Psora crenata]
MPPPNPTTTKLTPEQLAESSASEVYVAVTFGTVIGIAGVTLRCVSRRMSKTKLSYDDYLIVLAAVSLPLFLRKLNQHSPENPEQAGLVAHNILTQIITVWGLGRHMPAVMEEWPSFQKVSPHLHNGGSSSPGYHAHVNQASLGILCLYFTVSFLTKSSLLAFYFRIFAPVDRFRHAIYVASAIIFCQFISAFFASLFQCVPMAGFWHLHLKNAKCVNLSLFGVISGVLNFATDIMILCLPLPMIWSLNINKVQKASLTGIFMLGTFVCITSVIRIAKLVQLGRGGDVTWRLVGVDIWSALEASMGVFSACLPTMRPLVGPCVPLLSKIGKPFSKKKESSSGSQRIASKNFERLGQEIHLAEHVSRDRTRDKDRLPWNPDAYELDYGADRQTPSICSRMDKELPGSACLPLDPVDEVMATMPANSAASCANPLFLEWIKEIYDLAKERNTKGVTTYKRAYESMKACPLAFSHPSEAIQLDGIGPKICDRLTEKLKEHCEANGLPVPKEPRGKARKRLSAEDLEPAPAKKPRKSKPYVPSLRTGPYAIIMALSTLPQDSLQSLTKAQVIELAQSHCDSSFSVPSEAGKLYTAWNSMVTLINKDLVQERGRPLRKYALTEEGWDTARRIRAVQKGDLSSRNDKKNQEDPFACPDRADIPSATVKGANILVGLQDDVTDQDTLRSATQSLEKQPSLSRDPKPSFSNNMLGNAPMHKFRTHSKARGERRPKPASETIYVELLSSPEPAENPWSSSSFQQDARVLKPSSGNRRPASSRPACSKSLPPKSSANQTAATTSTKPSENLPAFKAIDLPPGSFTIRLVLDNREVRTKEDRDYIADQLALRNAPPLVRPLPLGDAFWVAKLHDPTYLSRYGEEGDEVVLDWIVERKRLDDLVGSITDGRFQEQKFRLRRSGVKNVVYLIEEITLSQEKAQKFSEAITSAIASTQVVNGYFVKRTQKLDESIRYLARLTTLLKSLYESKPLHVIPSSALTPTTYLPLLTHLRSDPTHNHRNYNITFPSFASLASKTDTITLRDVYLKMLMCTRGISGDKALAIQKVWSTPTALVEAFEDCTSQRERGALVEKHLGSLVGRGRIKGVLGAKVADVWGEE